MAPKKKGEKAAKAAPKEESSWVPVPGSEGFTRREGPLVQHLRAGNMDVVRGVHEMRRGLHRITYKVNGTANRKGRGLLRGFAQQQMRPPQVQVLCLGGTTLRESTVLEQTGAT